MEIESLKYEASVPQYITYVRKLRQTIQYVFSDAASIDLYGACWEECLVFEHRVALDENVRRVIYDFF